MDRRSRKNASLFSVAIVTLALLMNGCEWQKPAPVKEEKFDPSDAASIHVPPKDLVQLIQKNLPAGRLAIPMDTVQDGVILTGWKEYEGAIHIVRRWRERTRFKISVSPDFNDPLGTSHVEVFDETEEKPSDPQPWYPNPDLRRQERSDEVLKAIQEMKLKSETGENTNLHESARIFTKEMRIVNRADCVNASY